MDWLNVMVNSLVEYIKSGLEIYNGDMDKAIEYAKERTCGGTKAWELAIAKVKSSTN